MPANANEKSAYENCARELFKDAGPIKFEHMDAQAKRVCQAERLKMGDKAFFEKYGQTESAPR